jgi:hypothetical protein
VTVRNNYDIGNVYNQGAHHEINRGKPRHHGLNKGNKMSTVSRIVVSILWLGFIALASVIFNAPATLALGKVAGNQFDPSDSAYLVTQAAFRTFNAINASLMLFGAGILLSLWYRPIKTWITALLAVMLFIVCAPHTAEAYYDKSDYSENYFVLPNESAFFVPDVGDNKSSQASFGSEAYLSEKKIAAKRFEVPHTKLGNSGLWSNFYVPAGRLIIVDRTPVSREWVKQPHRGTDKTDQSFPCQSSEGLDITVGIAIGASVYEENAAKFLFRFGVNPPAGDRNDPVVIFTSVYYGKSLAQVMDGPVRSRVQSLVCDEMTSRTLDKNNAEAAPMMANIQKKVDDYMKSVGITLDFIGWADTFNFDGAVQASIDRRYIATQDLAVAESLAPHTGTLQALATAEGTRTVANKWNGAVPTSVSLWWLPAGMTDWFSKAGAK